MNVCRGFILAAAISLCFAVTLNAQGGARLLPIAPSEIPGAHGSTWITEHYAHNHGDEVLWITNLNECDFSVHHACDAQLAPGRTIRITGPQTTPPRPYDVWMVTAGDASAFGLSSFGRNTAIEVDPWGTAIPTPLVEDFFTGPFHIAPVPGDPDYRVSLRVYALTEGPDLATITVETWLYGSPSSLPLTLADTLTVSSTPHPDLRGSYFELHDLLASVPGRTEDTRALIRISAPSSPEVPIWGFASLTHNTTQHVTIFAP